MAKHLAYLDRELTDIAAGRNDRLIVSMPPRHGKTHLCGEFFPVWYLGNYPQKNFMYCSATDAGAESKSRAARAMTEYYGPLLWGRGLASTPRGAGHWKVAHSKADEGEFFAAGVGSGRIMGQGAHVLMIDDFFRNVEDSLSETIRQKQVEWFLSTSSTRLMPGGAIVIIATRWHREDLIGFALRLAEDTGDHWKVIEFPAFAEPGDVLGREVGEPLWPEQWPKENLEKKKQIYTLSGYPWMWEALYQQQPPEVIDSEWPSEYFSEDIWYDEFQLPRNMIDIKVLSLDPSKGKTEKSDYSAFVKVQRDREGIYWIEADMSQQRDVNQIVIDGMTIAKDFRPNYFGVESNGFQELLKDILFHEATRQGISIDFRQIVNTDNKMTRIRRLGGLLAKKRIRLKKKSPGTAILYEQMRGFPGHRYDDGPDALEMGIRLADAMLSKRPTTRYPSSVSA